MLEEKVCKGVLKVENREKYMSQNIITTGSVAVNTCSKRYELNETYENLVKIDSPHIDEELVNQNTRNQGLFSHAIFSNIKLIQREATYCAYNPKKEIKIADIRKSLTPDGARSLYGFESLLKSSISDEKREWLRININNAELPSDYKAQLLRKLDEHSSAR